MTDRIEIRGKASEFESAVIAVVLDRIAQDEKAAEEVSTGASRSLSAWNRVVRSDQSMIPLDDTAPFRIRPL